MGENQMICSKNANSTTMEQEDEQQPVAARTRRLSNTNTVSSRLSSGEDKIRGNENADLDGLSLPSAVTIDELADILAKKPESRSELEVKILKEWSFLVTAAESKIKSIGPRRLVKQNDSMSEDPQQPVAARTRRLSNTNTISSQSSGLDEDKIREVENADLDSMSLPLAVTIDELVNILDKKPEIRSELEVKILEDWSFLIPAAESKIRSRRLKKFIKQRVSEQEEPLEVIEQKAETLAQLIEEANYVVIYTGAGISTSASIPDYRGPNGLWTQLRKTGSFSITKTHDLSQAKPTLTHMAIRELCKRRIVNHVVSQNCDGLHFRSGIPQSNLSEIHGNMYIEVCPTCERQYFRQADITGKTSRFRHKTGRKCHTCAEPNNNLIDTIVLYGERSRTKWPMNWERASKAAKKADLIICLGSSLKTLRRYNCLWPKGIYSSSNKEPETKLAIINLQYTSKDKNAVLKINGKCDLVMQLIMQKLNIEVPNYDWSSDPLLKLSTPFTKLERAELKRNLIFESSQHQQAVSIADAGSRQCSASPSQESSSALNKRSREQSGSPSLFVSELTDDPERKKLKMRIRAVNVEETNANNDSTSPSESSSLMPNRPLNARTNQHSGQVGEELEVEEAEKEPERFDYALPGWLGKSLGASRTSSYKRKRHGNKGRKHSAKPIQ